MEQLKLQPEIISHVDISRLIRELGSLNDFFVGAQARSPGTAMQRPKLTRMLDTLAEENKINLLDDNHRQLLLTQLKSINDKAPKIHISFAAEPSPKALEKILVWLRINIHPHVLLQVGLQPAIAAGIVLRTPNKVFDMSMKASLKKQGPYLIKLIRGASGG